MTRWSAARQLLTSITSLSTTLVMRTLRKFHLPGAACHAPTNLVILALYWWSQKFFLKVFSSWEREPLLGGSGLDSLRSKRFQSSYCAQREQKKKWRGEGEGRRGSTCPPTSWFWKTPLDISRFGSFVNWQLVKTEVSRTDYPLITRFVRIKITLFSNRKRSRRLQKL